MLNTVTFGNSTNPPLIIAHGLFGSARNWGVLSKRLSDAWHVIGVDLRNHGDSDFYSIHNYSYNCEWSKNHYLHDFANQLQLRAMHLISVYLIRPNFSQNQIIHEL